VIQSVSGYGPAYINFASLLVLQQYSPLLLLWEYR